MNTVPYLSKPNIGTPATIYINENDPMNIYVNRDGSLLPAFFVGAIFIIAAIAFVVELLEYINI